MLYVDHQGHPAPITECFIATGGHQLASRVRRYPSSIAETMESAFCPACLDQNFYDSLTAVDQQGGYCPICVQCPNCLSNLSVKFDEANETQQSLYMYKCGQCDYSFSDPTATSLQALKDFFDKQREDQQASFSELMDYATSKWNTKLAPPTPRKEPRTGALWSLELLEAKTNKFKRIVQEKHCAELESTKSIQRISIQQLLSQEISPTDDSIDQIIPKATKTPMTQAATQDIQPLELRRLPLRTPLLVRRSLRCRAELDAGRPGILLKPKLSPLEGDSCAALSQNTSSQWHRKDSSAIHIVPRLRFVDQKKLQPDQHGVTWYCGLLLISNPTLGMVRVKLSTSKYQGEDQSRWETVHDDDDDQVLVVVRNVLVDSLSQQYEDIVIPTVETTHSFRCPNETIELKSAEDAMLHGSFSTAKFVLASITERALEEPQSQVLAVKGHVALVQVASPTPVAVASLSIVDIGQGSWESSLLRKRETVSFDLVLGFTDGL